MRIVISILAFIVGMGCVAYAYVGAVLRVANDAGDAARNGDETGAVSMIIDFIMRGEVDPIPGYLYGGALLIVLAVVNLLLGNARSDEPDEGE
jgi:hypothetical protein